MDIQSESTVTTKVFVSYSRRDKMFVEALHAGLADAGIKTWVDWEGIPLSADWWAEIKAGIDSSDAFVFVISPDSLISDVCNDEIVAAVDNNKRLIPILHREPEKGNPIHPKISSHNWVFMRDETEMNTHLAEMISTISTDLGWVKSHTRLLERAVEWDDQTKNPSFLLRGDDLLNAESWLSSATEEKDPAPTDLQIDYIQASRRDATRRRRLTIGGIVIALIIAFLAIFATSESVQASRARDEAFEQRGLAEENARLAGVETDRAEAEAVRAEAEAERANEQELLALENAERAATSATELLIQPIIFEYLIEKALQSASQELDSFNVEVDPGLIVASTLLNASRYHIFLPSDDPAPPQNTSTMLGTLITALDLSPALAAGREPELGILYGKICHQLPFAENDKDVLPACTEAARLSAEVENAWLNFQVCSLVQYPQLESMSGDINAACNRLEQLARELDLGDKVNDVIDPGTNDLWTFEAEEGDTIFLLMSTPSDGTLDGFLDLYGEDGRLLLSDNQSGGLNDPLITFEVQDDGKYIVIARGFDVKTSGAYELELTNEPPAIYANIARGVLTAETPVSDSLNDEETHDWAINGEEGQTIGLTMSQIDGDLDSFLRLVAPDGSRVAEDNNSGGDRDARILTTLPTTGQYLVQAFANSGAGEYELALFDQAQELFSSSTLGELEAGEPIQWTLGSGSTDIWDFDGTAGETVAIAMVADNSEVDSFLQLMDPNGNIVAEDDDSYGDLDALIVVDLPRTGTYTLLAASSGGGSSGAYELELGDGSLDFAVGRPPNYEDTTYPDDTMVIVRAPSTLFTAPTSDADRITNIAVGENLAVLGRSGNSSWLYVSFTDNGGEEQAGFIAANRVEFSGDIDQLPLAEERVVALTTPDDNQDETTEVGSPVMAQASTLYAGPGSSYTQLDNVGAGTPVAIDGRSGNNSWLLISYAGANGAQPGFVSASRVDYAGSISQFAVVADDILEDVVVNPPPPLTNIVFTIDNSSGDDVCEIYISAAGEPWGDDRLGSGVLNAGNSTSYSVAAGDLDVQVWDCNNIVIYEDYGFTALTNVFIELPSFTTKPPTDNDILFSINNTSDADVCFIYISAAGEPWGDDRLGSDILGTGSSASFAVAAGDLDVQVWNCNNNVIYEDYSFSALSDTYLELPFVSTDPDLGDDILFFVDNTSGVDVCEIYISAAGDDWGSDRLGNGTLSVGSSASYTLSAGDLDVLVIDCSSNVIYEDYGFSAQSDYFLSLPPANSQPEPEPDIQFTIDNTSGQDVCFIYISAAGDAWGDDRLGNDILSVGSSVSYLQPAGDLDVQVLDCNSNVIYEDYGFSAQSDYFLSLPQDNSQPDPVSDIQFTIDNTSGQDVCFIYISAAGDAWGDDRLGNDILSAGSSVSYSQPAGNLDVQVWDCAGNVIYEDYGFSASSDYYLVLP